MPYVVDFPAPETAVEWRLTDDGAERREVTYRPRFHVAPTADNDLDRVEGALCDHPEVHAVARERHRPGWRADAVETLAVTTTTLETVLRLATTVARIGRPGAYRCFDVDLSRGFRYCLETGADPTPRRRPTVCRLRTPTTTFADGGALREVTATTSTGEEARLTGDPATVAAGVAELVAETDPDVLRVSSGELVPTLFAAGDDPAYRLGREPGYTRLAGANTYESYGRVGHSPARYAVPGRAVVDESSSFFLPKTGLDGVLDLVERSGKPLQEASWASIGAVLTAIQVREAKARDVLVPWRAWRPEFFKSARTLEAADRGGFTFSPDAGFYEDVHELDFASLYPNIMVTRNVSPETVCCDCHPTRRDVPGLGYAVCPDRGYLPDVLEPLVVDRARFKERLRATDDPAERDRLEARREAIKWVLVACFGYQGFSNAKFGRIECHEAINAFAREILLDATDVLERRGWRVVHGIVDSLWVQAASDCEQTPLADVADEITERTNVRLEYEGRFDWVAFCPRRGDDAGALTRYFGKRAGEPVDDPASYKRRGIECRQRSTPPFVADVQLELVQVLGETRSPERVCDRLHAHVRRLEAGDVDPERLAVRNRVSKPRAEYAQATRNVAALERATAAGLDVHPGQDVRYVVVDDEKRGRDRVALRHEAPSDYDAGFYADLLVRATESLLAPLGWREDAIRGHLADRVDATIQSFR